MFAIFRSMHGRLFLILLVGMIVTAAGTILLTHSRQQEMFERVRAQHLAAEITELVETLERAPAPQRNDYPACAPRHGHTRESELLQPAAFRSQG